MKLQCPHCKTSFQVDENDYAAILAQVKNAEFDAEIERHLKALDTRFRAEEKARALEAEKRADKKLAEANQVKASLELEIASLKSKLENYETSKLAEMANVKAANAIEIANLNSAKERELNELSASKEREMNALSASKDREINELKNRIALTGQEHALNLEKERTAWKENLSEKEREVSELTSKLESQAVASENRILELKESHSLILKAKDEEIAHYKDMKSRLSTKLLGESLEVHCHNLFNSARSMGQFPNAYFEKDNDSSRTGTKGDFIFRDYINGDEYISIMFEMKTEDENTVNKHRNEDFLKKLDKDRRDKGCEYAVLVTMLEADSEFYNQGIVDVSYLYDKMYVIRPQFFMAVISLLSRTALRGATRLIELKNELELAKAQTIDVTNFERRRDQFVENFGKLVSAHIKKQDDAIAGLDKAIEQAERQAENLRKVKAMFEASRQKLLKANEAAENDFTIKKLVHGNKTMRAKFEEARRLQSELSLPSDTDNVYPDENA